MHETNATYLSLPSGKHIGTRTRPCIMGIVNVTPDSFSDGGRFYSPDAAVEHGLRLVAEGADILDIGGESTRPGAGEVETGEELRRVVPVIERLRISCDVPLSIDTRKAVVAVAALAAGADIVNDVSAMHHDPRMSEVVATAGVPVVLMHMCGTPTTMQLRPRYDNVLEDIQRFFVERISHCEQHGIRHCILDPGIGFGKTVEHNIEILAGLRRFSDLGRPVLIGLSRKSFIGQVTGMGVEERLPGSIAAAVLALRNGASMFRVHDVRESRSALDVAQSILLAEETLHGD